MKIAWLRHTQNRISDPKVAANIGRRHGLESATVITRRVVSVMSPEWNNDEIDSYLKARSAAAEEMKARLRSLSLEEMQAISRSLLSQERANVDRINREIKERSFRNRVRQLFQ